MSYPELNALESDIFNMFQVLSLQNGVLPFFKTREFSNICPYEQPLHVPQLFRFWTGYMALARRQLPRVPLPAFLCEKRWLVMVRGMQFHHGNRGEMNDDS